MKFEGRCWEDATTNTRDRNDSDAAGLGAAVVELALEEIDAEDAEDEEDEEGDALQDAEIAITVRRSGIVDIHPAGQEAALGRAHFHAGVERIT